MDLVVKRFEVYLINLDPTIGSEIQKNPLPCYFTGLDEQLYTCGHPCSHDN